MRRRHKGEGRGDDLARDAQRLHTNLQCYHAIGEKRYVLHPEVFSQFGFKLAVELAVVREPLVIPNLAQIGDELVQ